MKNNGRDNGGEQLISSHLLHFGRPVMIVAEEEEQGLGVAEEEERRLRYGVGMVIGSGPC